MTRWGGGGGGGGGGGLAQPKRNVCLLFFFFYHPGQCNPFLCFVAVRKFMTEVRDTRLHTHRQVENQTDRHTGLGTHTDRLRNRHTDMQV